MRGFLLIQMLTEHFRKKGTAGREVYFTLNVKGETVRFTPGDIVETALGHEISLRRVVE